MKANRLKRIIAEELRKIKRNKNIREGKQKGGCGCKKNKR